MVSKLRCPAVRPGAVRRSLVIERLARGDSRPIVSLVAPAGYGKTTLLSQWAERHGQPLAWVSLDERDNNPKVLLTYIAEALNVAEPIDERVFDALASPDESVPDRIVPALGSAFSSMRFPVVLVLDDVHVLHDHECWDALSVLAGYAPDGSRLVLAGRGARPLPLTPRRAAGRILEIGLPDLALTHEEASSLLGNVGVSVGEDGVAELRRRTEGWPAGLYLAALGLQESGPRASAADFLGGDDRLVSEYIESEFLARTSARQRAFLARTAVLDSIAIGDVDTVTDLAGRLGIRAYRQGRVTTVRRWFGWLEDRGKTAGHPMLAVTAGVLSALTGRPADAERWAQVADARQPPVIS